MDAAEKPQDSSGLSDANLLFGVLALQTGVITDHQLLAAIKSWTFNKSRRLSEILEENSALTHSQIEILEPMVQAQARLHDDDLHAAVNSLQSQRSLSLVHDYVDDREVQASLLPFVNAQPADPNETYMTLNSAADDGAGRYQVLRPHARGGLGEVYVAKDKELNREVALKEIQVQFSGHDEARLRFLREAEITGNLEHPGIVPVYGVGQYEDGRPYYAMRFVEGQSLKQLVDAFFANFKGRSLGRNIEWRRILGLIVSVCKAIDYAHSRGVIHRDIKPSNIMAGRFGEALVVDWGLAKVIGSSEPAAQKPIDLPRVSNETSGSGSSETMEGSALGTPAFMSPEQAMGNVEGTGPASDIYSLGATLYYALCGKVPFEDESVESTLEMVRNGVLRSPREIRPGVPNSLSQVCLKAMQRLPENRYQTCREIAEDLELWLADEAVSVSKGNLSERSGRWMRANRGFVQASFISMVLLTLLSVVAAFEFQRLRGTAEAQRLNAQQASDNNKKLASEKAELAEQEKNAKVEAQQLALDNQELAEESQRLASEMTLEAEKAKRISTFLINMFQAADPIGQGAAPGFLPKEKGGELTARQMLDLGAERIENDETLDDSPLVKATMMNAIGDAYRQLGIFEKAEPLLTSALAIREQHLEPNDPDIADSLHNLAWYFHERGNFPSARPLYDRALAIRRTIEGDEGRRLAANTLHNLAWMQANEGWTEEAIVQFEEALEIRANLLGDTHRDTMFTRFALCFTQFEQQSYLGAMSQLAFIIANQDSLEGDRNLVAAGIKFAQAVLRRDGNLGLAGMALGDPEANLKTAASLCEKSFGKGNVYVALVRAELGLLYQKRGRLDEAEAQYKISHDIARKRVQLEHPRIANLVDRYANLLKDLKRPEEGAQLWSEFMDAQRRRFDPRYGKVLKAAKRQADYLREIDQDEAAAKVYQEVARTLRSSVQEQSGYRYETGQLGSVLNALGITYDSLDERNEAKRAYQESITAYDSEPVGAERKAAMKIWPMINLAATYLNTSETDLASARLLMAQELLQLLPQDDHEEEESYLLEILIDLKVQQQESTEVVAIAMRYRDTIASDKLALMRLARSLCQCLTFSDSSERAQIEELALTTIGKAVSQGYAKEKVLDWKFLDQLQDLPRFQEIVGEASK